MIMVSKQVTITQVQLFALGIAVELEGFTRLSPSGSRKRRVRQAMAARHTLGIGRDHLAARP